MPFRAFRFIIFSSTISTRPLFISRCCCRSRAFLSWPKTAETFLPCGGSFVDFKLLFFFGMVIFTVIYFVVRWASGSWNITFKRGEAAYTCSRFWGHNRVGARPCASMFILLPAVLGIMQNSRVGSMIMGWNSLIYDEPKLFIPISFNAFFFPPDPPARMVYFRRHRVKMGVGGRVAAPFSAWWELCPS